MKIEKVAQDKKNKVANILFKIDTIKFGVFELSNGKASPASQTLSEKSATTTRNT